MCCYCVFADRSKQLPEDDTRTDGSLFLTSGSLIDLEALTTEQTVIAHMHLSQFAPTDRPPTEPTRPGKVNDTGSGNHIEIGNKDKSKMLPISDHIINELQQQDTKTTKVGLPENESLSGPKWPTTFNVTTIGILDVLRKSIIRTTTSPIPYREERLPPSFAHEHHHILSEVTETGTSKPKPRRKGPYFRPPSALSKTYRNLQPGDRDGTLSPACWPRCSNYTVGSGISGSKRKRKHSNYKKRFYNYKLLYDTLKVSVSINVLLNCLIISLG